MQRRPRLAVALLAAAALPCGALRPAAAARRCGPRRQLRRRANPVDEILAALDTMVGVSPLSEADLKSGDADLARRAEENTRAAPADDALEKPSVSIFFALLGAFPVAIMVAGLANGAKPFGL